jgi:hypothetical protein
MATPATFWHGRARNDTFGQPGVPAAHADGDVDAERVDQGRAFAPGLGDAGGPTPGTA